MDPRAQLHDGIKAEASIQIQAPVDEVYGFWRDFSHLPEIIPQLESVTTESPQRSHWVWAALRGLHKVSWSSEIIEDLPPQLISWKTLQRPGENSEVLHAGSVWFHPLENGATQVRVQLIYWPRGGKMVDWMENILGESPQEALREGLARLRIRLESRPIKKDETQSLVL